MTSSCSPHTGSECFQPLFSRLRLSHSQFFDCVGNPPPNSSRSRVTDSIRNLYSFSGDISPRLTSGRVSMSNLLLYLDIPQPSFQDSDTPSASFISGRRHHAVSLSPLRCDDGVVRIISAGISFIEQPPPSAVCSPHTAAHSSLGDSSISRYTHHASSTVSVPPFRRAVTPVPPTRVVSFPSLADFSSASQNEITQPSLVQPSDINQFKCNLFKPTSQLQLYHFSLLLNHLPSLVFSPLMRLRDHFFGL